MAPRRYQMDRRAEAAAETRQKIVAASLALHTEKGVAATTFRDISTRADVGIGTVYHHFPTYDDVIAACGNHAMTLARPPQPVLFDGVNGIEARIHVLVREQLAFYDRMPNFALIRSERHQFAALDRGMKHEEENRLAMIAEALRGSRAAARARATLFALLDIQVYETLGSAGLDRKVPLLQ